MHCKHSFSLSTNPGEVFNNKNAKWHTSHKVHIPETKLLKAVSNKRKKATKTVPVKLKKPSKSHSQRWPKHLLWNWMLRRNDRRRTSAWDDAWGGRCMFQVVCNIHEWYWITYQTFSGDLIVLETKYHNHQRPSCIVIT